MTPDDSRDLADAIIDARAHGRLLAAPLDHGLTADQAYAIQSLVLHPRMARGGGRGGWKLGYTSEAMREQMGVAEPNYGPLAKAMFLPTGATVSEGVVHPRVEPEVAAVVGRDIPPDAELDEVRAAVAHWRIALEIVDSVWQDYRFDWSLNTADGSSAAFVVMGEVIDLTDSSPLPSLEVDMRMDGEVVGRGRVDAAMGDPAVALHWLVSRLAEQGEIVRAGDTVITGGLTAAHQWAPGAEVSAAIGSASVRAVRGQKR